MSHTVDVRILALHVGCDACGETARINADCDVYATWATPHMQPRLIEAEVLIDGALCRRPIRAA